MVASAPIGRLDQSGKVLLLLSLSFVSKLLQLALSAPDQVDKMFHLVVMQAVYLIEQQSKQPYILQLSRHLQL